MKKNIFLILIFFLYFTKANYSQLKSVDTLEFPIGYPFVNAGAQKQLKSFPSPRYSPNNNFIRLFNWMNPYYMGGGTQPGVSEADAIKNAEAIQEELILHWNYSLIIPNSTIASSKNGNINPNTPIGSYIRLANKYPQIPLGVTTFWGQLNAKLLGYDQREPAILKKNLPDKYYLKDASGKVIKKVLNFAAPDSLFITDGKLQRKCLENIVKHLTRPINIICENGEEPPGITIERACENDADMIAEKKAMGIDDWHIYISEKKKHFRNLYSSQFMDKLPELKNTAFTVYCIEGGPVDRFDWKTSRETATKIKGNYYSTPDFYPRYPDNWQKWRGAWHGWKWINDGRKVEITAGDKFFSPFIAAGWSANPEEDIRPAQWLGLLKCLSVVGAEFYYVGYFNLKQPFNQPKNYVWQAAMPAYAQAIATHFKDVFLHGNVIMDDDGQPIVTYPASEKNVLVAVRKLDNKEKYVIAATVQPSSNTEKFALDKDVKITLGNEDLIINSRRQGSVYIYDKSISPPLFYQLDRWHEYTHPMRWRKFWIAEAEVFDTASNETNLLIKSEYRKGENVIDLRNVCSYVLLNYNRWVQYNLDTRDLNHLKEPLYCMLLLRSKEAVKLNIIFDGKVNSISDAPANGWKWIIVPLQISNKTNDIITLRLESLVMGLEIDKVIVKDGKGGPDLKGY